MRRRIAFDGVGWSAVPSAEAEFGPLLETERVRAEHSASLTAPIMRYARLSGCGSGVMKNVAIVCLAPSASLKQKGTECRI